MNGPPRSILAQRGAQQDTVTREDQSQRDYATPKTILLPNSRTLLFVYDLGESIFWTLIFEGRHFIKDLPW